VDNNLVFGVLFVVLTVVITIFVLPFVRRRQRDPGYAEFTPETGEFGAVEVDDSRKAQVALEELKRLERLDLRSGDPGEYGLSVPDEGMPRDEPALGAHHRQAVDADAARSQPPDRRGPSPFDLPPRQPLAGIADRAEPREALAPEPVRPRAFDATAREVPARPERVPEPANGRVAAVANSRSQGAPGPQDPRLQFDWKAAAEYERARSARSGPNIFGDSRGSEPGSGPHQRPGQPPSGQGQGLGPMPGPIPGRAPAPGPTGGQPSGPPPGPPGLRVPDPAASRPDQPSGPPSPPVPPGAPSAPSAPRPPGAPAPPGSSLPSMPGLRGPGQAPQVPGPPPVGRPPMPGQRPEPPQARPEPPQARPEPQAARPEPPGPPPRPEPPTLRPEPPSSGESRGRPPVGPAQGTPAAGAQATRPTAARPVPPPVAEPPKPKPQAQQRPSPPVPPLVSTSEADRFRARFNTIKGAFPDDPEGAVKQAGELLEEFTELVSRRLDPAKDDSRGDRERSTEDLRIALQRYRAVLERMLS
jgi:hypothetical protein